VYLGHGEEASDHIQHLILNGSYGRTLVFRPTGGTPIGERRLPPRHGYGSGGRKPALGSRSLVAKSPIPHLEHPPAPTPAEIAQAKHAADLYAYLYDQGAVSRNVAEAKMQAWKALQASAGDKLASS
jgi:hypothetical protein